MAAVVLFHHEFAAEFGDYTAAVRDAVMAYVLALRQIGSAMDRPRSGTLNGKKYNKMKELRLTIDKVEWRIAYAFDTEQQGILLAGGSKNGMDEDRFYKSLIDKAERRLEAHESELAARSKAQQDLRAATTMRAQKGRRK